MRVALVIFLLTSVPVWSQDRDDEDQARFDEIVWILEQVDVSGYNVLDANRLAGSILRHEHESRHLTPELEIRRIGMNDISTNGGRPPRPRCFPGDMRVLTPQGLVPLDKLNEDDLVLSWDPVVRNVVTNRVFRKIVADDLQYGELCDLKPEGRSIRVTADHPLMVASTGLYRPVGLLKPATELLRVEGDAKFCETHLIKRGRYVPNITRGRVMTLQMQTLPRNYILEGIVVKNKPTIGY